MKPAVLASAGLALVAGLAVLPLVRALVVPNADLRVLRVFDAAPLVPGSDVLLTNFSEGERHTLDSIAAEWAVDPDAPQLVAFISSNGALYNSMMRPELRHGGGGRQIIMSFEDQMNARSSTALDSMR